MKAIVMGLGIGIAKFIVLAIDESGVTANVVMRSAVTGALAAALLALWFSFRGRRGQSRA